MQTSPAPRESVLEQLERMLASETFAGAERSRRLLRFLVEHALQNQSDRLKEFTIGSEALGRGDSFDPRIDPIVRAEASRLRTRIERYYATNGAADTLLISLPKGSYVPQFQQRAVPEITPVTATAGSQVSTAGRRQKVIWFVLGGVAVGAAVMLLVSMRPRLAPAIEFGGVVELGGEGYSPGAGFGNDVIISPDGTLIVFVGLGSDHVPRLMTMKLDPADRTIRRLENTDGAQAPFFSPDSRSVGFWANGKLKMISVDGGRPNELADAESFEGASWGQDGDIIAGIDHTLKRVSLTSRTPQLVADMREFGVVPWWPEILPGGEHVLFTAVGPHGPDASNLEVWSLPARTRTPLKIRAGFGRYLKGDYLLYGSQGTLFAVPFNGKWTVEGTGVPVLGEDVAYNRIFGNAKFDISRNGTLIYRRSPPLVVSWIDRSGKTDTPLTKPGAYTFPRVSPHGDRLTVNVTDSGVMRTEIHDLLRRGEPIRLPFPGSMSTVWHPRGFLVLGSYTGMSWLKIDDLSKLQTLTPSPNVQLPMSFTADGTRLAYLEPGPSLDIWTMPVSDSDGKLKAGTPAPFLRTPHVESAPSFSPDDRWLAYGSGRDTKWNVYVGPYPPDVSKEINVSQTGGRIPRWLKNGRELVYRTDDHRLMVVEYQVKDGTFIAGTPKEWPNVRLADTGVIPNFDVAGDRILGVVPASREEADRMRTQATVIPRFLEEVQRRLTRGRK